MYTGVDVGIPRRWEPGSLDRVNLNPNMWQSRCSTYVLLQSHDIVSRSRT